MWLTFEDIEFRTDLISKKGNKYSAHLLTATKKGYGDEEDSPYSKPIFEDTFTTVISRNGKREAEMAAHEFFEACEAGDLVIMTNKREGERWVMESLQNKTRDVLPEDAGVTGNPTPVPSVTSGWEAAVNFVNVLVNNGHYNEKTDPEILLDAVVTYHMRLEALDTIALDSDIEVDA